MSEPLHIDGSLGEGGGQILRSSLSLSLLTGRPFTLTNIRAKRKKPGLLRQHLTAVLAAAQVSGSTVHGAELGSDRLEFEPAAPRRGDYHFNIGSAGSTILVLQTLLPAFLPPSAARGNAKDAMGDPRGYSHPMPKGNGKEKENGKEKGKGKEDSHASSRETAKVDSHASPQAVNPGAGPLAGPVRFTLEGGTHNPFAPPYGFFANAFLPILQRMGVPVSAELHRPGFYPAGGGRLSLQLGSVPSLKPLDLTERGPLQHIHARILSAHLDPNVAKRESRVLQKRLNLPPEAIEIQDFPNSAGPGNLIEVHIHHQNIHEVITSVGRKSLRAESVAQRAATQTRNYLASQAPVGPHLADQLLIPFALAGRGSFRTLPLTPHCRTNLDILQQFTGVTFQQEELRPGLVELRVGGGPF
ncbi:MAG TPA: RNA 3'-terminal phosphate cyclase [Planctomycetes bacterium]|nr:RNA 3'-terminal phosphate cyclase [Planctomycetota bacterium]